MKDKCIYDSIFNNSHIPMLIIDCESGEIKDGNLAACRFYGYGIEELLKMKITDINTLNNEKREMEYMINMQESYFLSLYENSPEAIAVLDNEFRIISINKSFEKVFQYSIEDIKQRNITDVLCDEKFYGESEYFKDCITGGEFVREETLRKRKDGTLVNVSLLGYPITLKGEQIGVYVIYTDLSNVKEIESKKRLFSEIFRNNTVGVVITDIDGKIQWINSAFTEITGYTEKEVNGKKPNILKSGIHDQEYYSNMWNSILNSGKWQGEVFNKRKDGELYQISLNIFAIRDDKGIIDHFVGMLSDITDVKQKEIRIETLTNKDSLTDLFSRDYFVNRLNNEISRRNKNKDLDGKLAIIFLDIDDFKEINDTLGHIVGDIILKEFAKRLKASIRENDIAARFGGDEFIIMLLLAKENYEILHIANRILEEISKPFVMDSIELHITASLGIAKYPDDGSDSTALIRNADIAMYRSKENKSRKITMFESELDEEVREYFKIKNNLRNAVTNRELFLEYQPIIDAVENKIVGAEALLRWNYEGRKVIQPMKFIPVAEKNGYMQSIGEWVMLEACMQNKLWQNKGYSPIYVSVNVSIIQLEQPKFYETVEKVLNDSQLNPEYLQLEITETIFTKNYEKIADTIRRINELGVKIAIDDFGTGYSSMGQLSRLEIAKLKIDKSFIWEIHRSENKNKIVKAIISLAKSLNLDLTAEGVEASDQLDFLIENGCNIVQGYLYSKPLHSCDIEKLFQ